MLKENKSHSYHQLQLEHDEIHVWFVYSDDYLSQLHALFQELPIDEKNRADRFYFIADRNRYIVGKALLRVIIGSYLDIEPNRLQFCYGKNGKPALSDCGSYNNFYFNMSYSENIILYVFSRIFEVGIDVEHIRNIPEREQVVESFFSDREKKVFSVEPGKSKDELFFRLWTRKEAYLKGIGSGLSQSFDGFDVVRSLEKQNDSFIFNAGLFEIKVGKWLVRDLITIPGVAAAYAVNNSSSGFRFKYIPDNLRLIM